MTETRKIKVVRTDSGHREFRELVKKLDAELAVIDGPEHAFYHQFNGIENLNHAVVLYANDLAVAIGAMKQVDAESMEIKRMYTSEAERKKGHAKRVLNALEDWASEIGFNRCILETGKRQKAAVAMYEHQGYRLIPNFGPYQGVENSLCFEKKLTEK